MHQHRPCRRHIVKSYTSPPERLHDLVPGPEQVGHRKYVVQKREERNPPGVFNPTDARYEVATGRLDGHKVQESSRVDAKSDHERSEGREATSKRGRRPGNHPSARY
jgi:hypothetical protein